MKALTKQSHQRHLEPILHKVLEEAEAEHREMQEMFELLAWGDLPDDLKLEIRDDVEAYTNELKGLYSSCDPYVIRRRQSVDYWIRSYRNGICSLKTAIRALKVRPL